MEVFETHLLRNYIKRVDMTTPPPLETLDRYGTVVVVVVVVCLFVCLLVCLYFTKALGSHDHDPF